MSTIGHVLIDDHLVLRVDGDLGIVADGDLRMRRHGAAVGIGERHLAFAALFQRGKMRCIFAPLLFQRRDLFRQILDPRTAGRAFLGIARVEPFQIVLQLLVGGLDEFLQRPRREVPVLVVDRLDARAINRGQTSLSRASRRTLRCSLANFSRKTRRAASKGSIISANSGTPSTRSWIRCSKPTTPTISTFSPKLRNKPRISFSIARAFS